jgi:hypothetical protein
MSQTEFSAAFKNSPMKRAKLRGSSATRPSCYAAWGPDDADVLTRAFDDEEPLVREHAAWARAQIRR